MRLILSVNLGFWHVCIVGCLVTFKNGAFSINSKAPECSLFYMKGAPRNLGLCRYAL